jgi:DNA sulfur modification protein DndD
MLLKKITLTNFRQFYGEQTISISVLPDKNVTLIHAENGLGKTTILNAILWCFYKDTTARFEQPDKIANHQATSEGNFDVKVEVAFENDRMDFVACRSINERSGEEKFEAYKIVSGNYVKLDAPSAFIDSVVPREMARYFFFDGEFAETFSSQNNKAKVRDALEDMLGCRTANMAIKDLQGILGEYEKQIGALTKNNQAAAFQERIDILEGQNSRDISDLLVWEENLSAAKSAREEIRKQLRGAEGAGAIQKKREGLERDLARQVTKREKLEGQLCSWISDGGLSLISKHLEEKTQVMLEDAKLKGKIPSYIAETFVQDIQRSGMCICGRPFEEHSAEANAIERLLQDAGTAIATDRLMNARSLMATLSDKRPKASTDLTRIRDEIEICERDIGSIEAKIEECSVQLRGSDIQEIAERESALGKRDEEIDELTIKFARASQQVEERNVAIEENKKKRDRMLLTNGEAKALQKRCTLLKSTIERIEDELKNYRELSRNEIAKDVNEILENTARRAYVASIDERFNLDMYYQGSKVSVARSGGENQLLSLAFIAALIKFGADRIGDASQLLKPGTSAPLVLDSPFGQLDPTYQKATASFLPSMARQVILLVSKTQGNADVMAILKSKIGKQFVLVSENKGPQGDKPADIITLDGQEIQCSLYNCEKTLTRVVTI